MEISSEVENSLLLSSSNESMGEATEFLPLCRTQSQREVQSSEQVGFLQSPCNNATKNEAEPESETGRMDCSHVMEIQPNGVFTPLEPCGYVSYPGGNTNQEKDESNFQRSLMTVKPLPSYQIPIFASPNSLVSPTPAIPPQLRLNLFSWPNSVSSNGTQGCPAYYSSPSSTSCAFGQPTAFLYLPVLPVAATLRASNPIEEEKLSATTSSRKRKCDEFDDESDSCSNDCVSVDGYDCDCEDCRAFLQDDSDMSDDFDGANRSSSNSNDYNNCCSHCHRKCSQPFKVNQKMSSKNIAPHKKYILRKSVSCSSLHPGGSLQPPFPSNNAVPNIRSSCKLKDSYNHETSANEDTDTDSDNGNDYESHATTSGVESPDMNSRGTSPQNNCIPSSSNPSATNDFNHIVNSYNSKIQDKNDDQMSLNQASTTTAIPSSSCLPTLSMPNDLTSFSLDHSIPFPGISLTNEPALNLSMQTLPHTKPTCLSLCSNKDNLISAMSAPGADGDNPNIKSSNNDTNTTATTKDDYAADLQDSLDEQILQALRAALGIPDDVELEEYEPVDDDDENENADDEEDQEDDTMDVSVSPEEPQDPRGCLALVEDLVLSYGKISSASEKIKASIEGDVCRVVIGGFLVSASHITREKGRAGYSLGFYLDDLEINSFMLQVQDGILRVNGRRDKVDIYLRIEIGAPVRIEDVNVNHNKATNVVWVEVFF